MLNFGLSFLHLDDGCVALSHVQFFLFLFYFNAPDQTSYRHPSCTAPHSCRHCSPLDDPHVSHLTVIGPTLHKQLCALALERSLCRACQQVALKFYRLEKEERKKKLHYSPEYLSNVLKCMLGNEQPCLHLACKTFTDKRQSFCRNYLFKILLGKLNNLGMLKPHFVSH